MFSIRLPLSTANTYPRCFAFGRYTLCVINAVLLDISGYWFVFVTLIIIHSALQAQFIPSLQIILPAMRAYTV
jgi:hypothetical protein